MLFRDCNINFVRPLIWSENYWIEFDEIWIMKLH